MCPCRRGRVDVVSGFDPETLAFYVKEAPVYVSSRPDGEARYLAAFLDLLPKGASILELGCGGGRDAEFRIVRGFAVEATDGVPEIASQAAMRLGRPIKIMQFHELVAEMQYDAVTASASLLHVPRDALPDILGRIWRALRPGGHHFATYKGGGVEGRDEHGRYYNYPDRMNLEKFYLQSGHWADIDIKEYIGGGYFGKQGPWLRITAQKPY